MILKAILVVIESYVLGSIPFGYLVYRRRHGGDVRAIGSGNIGATNVLRGAGIAAGIATLLLDAAKGYLAVTLAKILMSNSIPWMTVAAVVAIAGHVFPIFLNFRGGKGVATGLGAFLAITPVSVLWAAGAFVLILAGSRYISLASLAAAASFPLVLWIRGKATPYLLSAAIFWTAVVIFRHKSNIGRLLGGTETRMGHGTAATGEEAAHR